MNREVIGPGSGRDGAAFVADLAQQFWREGYVVIEKCFEPAAMNQLNEAIRAHFGERPEFFHERDFLDRSRTEVIPWFPQREGPSAFDGIEADPFLRELTGHVLGDGWAPDYCMVMFSRRGTSGQAWHQDCPPERPELFNLNRLVYSEDISDAVGGQTLVVPGSHRRGLLPAGDPVADFDDQVVLRPTAGTLVLLHGHTWHRVLPVTGGVRFSTNFRARSPRAPELVTDVCVYRNMRYRFSTSEVIEERTTDV